jgi:hypothetical protein
VAVFYSATITLCDRFCGPILHCVLQVGLARIVSLAVVVLIHLMAVKIMTVFMVDLAMTRSMVMKATTISMPVQAMMIFKVELEMIK